MAGALDDFEKDATKQRKKKTHYEQQDNSYSTNQHDDDHDHADPISEFFGFFMAIGEISKGFADLTHSSWTRADYDTDSPYQSRLINDFSLKEKKPGETLIPYFRFDYHYQDQETDIYASDYRFLAGYGPWAIMGRKTYLREEEPFDKMRIDQLYGVLRLSISNYVEVGLGFGEYKIVGDDSNSGFSFTLPIMVRINEHFSIEALPTWASINENEIADYDLGVLFGTRYISTKVGFRRIESPNNHLQGPYVGLSLYY